MANTTWGKMVSAPANLVGGVGSVLKAIVKGAVVCGIAIFANEFLTNAFGIQNYAANVVEWIGGTLGPMFEGAINSIKTGIFGGANLFSSTDNIKNFIGTAGSIDLNGAGAIGTLRGWADGIANTIGSYVAGTTSSIPEVVGNTAVKAAMSQGASATIAIGGGGLLAGTVVGKYTAAEEQRRAQRAQALQQLG